MDMDTLTLTALRDAVADGSHPAMADNYLPHSRVRGIREYRCGRDYLRVLAVSDVAVLYVEHWHGGGSKWGRAYYVAYAGGRPYPHGPYPEHLCSYQESPDVLRSAADRLGMVWLDEPPTWL